VSGRAKPPKLHYVRPRRWISVSSPRADDIGKRPQLTRNYIFLVVGLAIVAGALIGWGIGIGINRAVHINTRLEPVGGDSAKPASGAFSAYSEAPEIELSAGELSPSLKAVR